MSKRMWKSAHGSLLLRHPWPFAERGIMQIIGRGRPASFRWRRWRPEETGGAYSHPPQPPPAGRHRHRWPGPGGTGGASSCGAARHCLAAQSLQRRHNPEQSDPPSAATAREGGAAGLPRLPQVHARGSRRPDQRRAVSGDDPAAAHCRGAERAGALLGGGCGRARRRALPTAGLCHADGIHHPQQGPRACLRGRLRISRVPVPWPHRSHELRKSCWGHALRRTAEWHLLMRALQLTADMIGFHFAN
mmetsp:Transcript_10306/g.31065  ORF Transcript_10306/g.31065 Transcript_10306/m.31065 type:complete len:247 (+) Transcript_10306:355-1095(+)